MYNNGLPSAHTTDFPIYSERAPGRIPAKGMFRVKLVTKKNLGPRAFQAVALLFSHDRQLPHFSFHRIFHACFNIKDLYELMAVARNLCAGGQVRGAPVTPVSRGVWGHGPPDNFEI